MRKGNKIKVLEKHSILYTSKGEEILVDNEDVELLSQYTWCVKTTDNYVTTRVDSKNYYMSRMILNANNGEIIDHINHNTLDNRKENLRICSLSQNCMNRRKYKNNTSGYKGISYVKRKDCWSAMISINKKQKQIGYFNTLEEAVEARKQAEIEYYREFAEGYTSTQKAL